ncbi:MAG: hypothetical protein BWY81_00714 [Firmicutes bacterium ADurb.Bin467]|nr:MAG: hypothetical protein BWY81_00714 [Firmicutes bacterium ADurb.Bin467]
MPPVLRPKSRSFARLWSIDDTIGTIALPSVNASTDTSGPSRYSSMTTRLPLLPNARSSMMRRTASSASPRVSQIRTPFPSASPLALTTSGASALFRYSSAPSASSNTSNRAVGMPYFCISRFENALLASISAARASGPKHGMPSACSRSTAPSASGSSGATTAKSIALSPAKRAMPSMSVALIGTHTASFAMPPFPGSA